MLLPKSCLSWLTLTEIPLILSTDATDTGMEQEQEGDRRVVKRVIGYASNTINASQMGYCTSNKELLPVFAAVELFKYYLIDRHIKVMTHHASLAWLRNFKEAEGTVALRITLGTAIRFQDFSQALQTSHPS